MISTTHSPFDTACCPGLAVLTAQRTAHALRYKMSFMQIVLNLHTADLCLLRLELTCRISFRSRSPRHAVRLAARKISLDLFHLNKEQRQSTVHQSHY